MVWGCISAYGMGSLHVLEGTMNAEMYLEQHMLPPPDDVYFNRTMQNHILQLLQQHRFVVEESGCWIGLPAVQIFHLENIWRIIKRKMSKTTTKSSAAGNLYQARMGPNCNTKTPETHNLDTQTSSNCFEKKRRCYTMVNMPPSQQFWDLCRYQIWN